MADTGWVSPTSTGGTYNNWTNPTDAYASDNSYATVSYAYADDLVVGISIDGGSNYYPIGSLDSVVYIILPSGSSNEDFVTVGSPTDLWDQTISPSDLSGDNFRIVVGPEDAGGGIRGPLAQEYYGFGLSIDSGSTILGIEIKTEGYKESSTSWYVDHIQVKVYYTISDTGWASPGTTTNTTGIGTVSWANTSNAVSSNNAYATTSSYLGEDGPPPP